MGDELAVKAVNRAEYVQGTTTNKYQLHLIDYQMVA